MNRFTKLAAAVVLSVVSAGSASAAQIQFSGLYSITTDVPTTGVSPGDSFSFSSILVTSADPTYAPDVVFGSAVSDFSLTASLGANVGTSFSVGGDTFTISTTSVATAFPPFTLISGGLGDLSGNAGSWYVSFLGTSATGGFQGLIETPPGTIPGQVPVPAALPMLAGALGGMAFLRRRA